MANIFNEDFRDFIHALNQSGVKYILVGGYSVIIHGYNRTTGDMDIWVNKTENNYEKLVKAFAIFGMPVFDMNKQNFLNNAEVDVFTFGRPPVSIDILTNVKGANFEDAFASANWFTEEGLNICYINLQHLIQAKKAVGRNKDMDDLNNLIK